MFSDLARYDISAFPVILKDGFNKSVQRAWTFKTRVMLIKLSSCVISSLSLSLYCCCFWVFGGGVCVCVGGLLHED